MGFFSNKKKEEPKVSQFNSMSNSDMAEFPSADQYDNFPKYEPTVADIKKQVGDGMDSDDMPVRRSNLGNKRLAAASFKPVPENSDVEEISFDKPSPKRMTHDEGKPLFVRLDNYKEVINTIELLKEKLSEAESTLKALEEVKEDEDKKLQAWKRDLTVVKEKLMTVDKNLFEV